jgi:hypothetical protein
MVKVVTANSGGMSAPHRAVYSGILQRRRRAQKRLRQPKKMTARRFKTELSLTKNSNIISANNCKVFLQIHLAPMLRIRVVYPGSKFFPSRIQGDPGVKKIPDPHQIIEVF